MDLKLIEFEVSNQQIGWWRSRVFCQRCFIDAIYHLCPLIAVMKDQTFTATTPYYTFVLWPDGPYADRIWSVQSTDWLCQRRFIDAIYHLCPLTADVKAKQLSINTIILQPSVRFEVSTSFCEAKSFEVMLSIFYIILLFRIRYNVSANKVNCNSLKASQLKEFYFWNESINTVFFSSKEYAIIFFGVFHVALIAFHPDG